jgi:hypothetical protein
MGKKWLSTDFLCAFFVCFMSEKGGAMTQKRGFLCQNMPTYDVFFLPFGILEDVKMTFKTL